MAAPTAPPRHARMLRRYPQLQLQNKNVISIMDHSQIEKDIDWFENQQPSTENMVVFIWEKLADKIPSPAKLHSIKLQETPTISTKYYGPKS